MIIIGLYRPPKMNEIYLELNDEHIETFSGGYNLYNLVEGKICFKGTLKCYDLILSNCKHNFQNTATMNTGFSDFHKMVVTVLKTEFVKVDPLKITYRDYKNYNSFEFNKDLKTKLISEPS